MVALKEKVGGGGIFHHGGNTMLVKLLVYLEVVLNQ